MTDRRKPTPQRRPGSTRSGAPGARGQKRARADGANRSERTSKTAGTRSSDPTPREVDEAPRGKSNVELSRALEQELRSSARPGKDDVLIAVFSRAVEAYSNEDLEEAVRLGEQSKHIALRSASIREFLGLAYYAQGRWKEAARELAAFRRLTGSTAQNHVIADCYRALGRPAKALEYTDEVSRKAVGDEVFYEVQIVAAGATADLGHVEHAIARLEKLDLEPTTAAEHHLRAWYVLGDLLERAGRFTQARAWFEAVHASDPTLTDADERAEKLQASS